MPFTVNIDPITRIEGHLAIKVEVTENAVSKAYSSGEMFRGFETILKGRDPLDAQQITQRICGVCPISHGTASVLAQDMAYGIQLTENGRLARNLISGANFIQSHIIHFYHLSAIDFIDIAAITKYKGADPALNDMKNWVSAQLASKALFPAAPFLPRYDTTYLKDLNLNIAAIKHYLEAFEMRALAHKMGAIFGGKLPHATALIPGGVTEKVDAAKIGALQSILSKLRAFIDHCYLPDVIAVAQAFPEYRSIGKGPGNFMAYGVFPEAQGSNARLLPAGVVIDGKLAPLDVGNITEDVAYSYYSSGSGLRPDQGETLPEPEKRGAYSWLKAPRYNGTAMEVGPLARLIVAYMKGQDRTLMTAMDDLMTTLGISFGHFNSVIGRHAARAIECKLVADRCAEWIDQLVPDQPTFTDFNIPENAQGIGLTEAPRGSLGHWLQIEKHKIARYQCVVPTTWNCSPRDDKGNPGPVELALIGTPVADAENPMEAARVVRSFDPCIACAVH